MALEGLLTRERIGYSMPAISPIFTRPPFYMKDAEIVSVNFETETEAARRVLPAPLKLEEPATATLAIAYIPASSFGMYYEAMLILPCLFEGQPHRYDVMFMVTNDIAFALGRETHGASKKMGNVMLEVRNEGVFGYAERPQGHRLLTVGVAPEQYIEPDPGSLNVVPSVSLRVIGQPAGCDPDVTMELIQTPAKWKIQEQWSGPGMIGFPESSAIDNWQVLPVKKIVGAFFSKVDIEIPLPNLLARL